MGVMSEKAKKAAAKDADTETDKSKATETAAAEPQDEAAAAEPGGATPGELAALARVDAAEQRAGQLERQLADAQRETRLRDEQLASAAERQEALEREIADRGVEVDNVRDQLRTAEARAASAGQAKPKRGKVGRKAGPLDEEADKGALIAAGMEKGEALELVASDGEREIVALDPIEVTPDKFRRIGQGEFQLNEPVLLRGTSAGILIDGFALLDGAGKQVGYAAQLEKVELRIGQERKFTNLRF